MLGTWQYSSENLTLFFFGKNTKLAVFLVVYRGIVQIETWFFPNWKKNILEKVTSWLLIDEPQFTYLLDFERHDLRKKLDKNWTKRITV